MATEEQQSLPDDGYGHCEETSIDFKSPKSHVTDNLDSSRDWRLYNVILLGVSFMLLFTAFQTCSMIEESVLNSVKNETNGTFKGDGYTSLAIIYSVFAISNWVAPAIVAGCGPKGSMLLGGVMYCVFIISFLKPMTWSLYLVSILVGFGAAVIWTGQGNFLSINSDSQTAGRNSGIFWALLQCSLVFGNLYVYFAFKGDISIAAHTRWTVFLVLSVTGAAGWLTLLLLRSQPRPTDELLVNEQSKQTGIKDTFVSSFKLFVTSDMLLLSVCFAYTGFELTFFSGVYGTSVGNNQHFGSDAKGLIGICGIFIGVGEILGGGSFGILGSRTNKYGRDPIVLLGFIAHIITFYLIFLNQPMESPIRDTMGDVYITPNKYIALLCAFLLGFGDSCFNTQIYSVLSSAYQDQSAEAFAIFKFVQSLAAAAGFFYSNHLLLQWQLLILVVLAVAGAWCFFVVEWRIARRQTVGYKEM